MGHSVECSEAPVGSDVWRRWPTWSSLLRHHFSTIFRVSIFESTSKYNTNSFTVLDSNCFLCFLKSVYTCVINFLAHMLTIKDDCCWLQTKQHYSTHCALHLPTAQRTSSAPARSAESSMALQSQRSTATDWVSPVSLRSAWLDLCNCLHSLLTPRHVCHGVIFSNELNRRTWH
jgi:hypothetical protein